MFYKIKIFFCFIFLILIKESVRADLLLLSTLESKLFSAPEQRLKNDEAVLSLWDELIKNDRIIQFKDIIEVINCYIESFEWKDCGSDLVFQKKIISTDSKIVIVGDLHGSAHSLVKIIKNFVNDDYKIIKDNVYIVFTGDYVDRGAYGIEVWYILLRLKLANSDHIFILRGNHENWLQNQDGKASFYLELTKKYGERARYLFGLKFSRLYQNLLSALYVKSGESWVQFSHGGLEVLFNIDDFLNSEIRYGFISPNKLYSDFTAVRNGFLWGDFQCDSGVVYMNLNRLGLDVLLDMNHWFKETQIKAIFRGHQHNPDGFSVFRDINVVGIPGSLEFPQQPSEGPFTFRVKVADYFPIFTFTSGAEYGISRYAFYGILNTAPKFSDCFLDLNFI